MNNRAVKSRNAVKNLLEALEIFERYGVEDFSLVAFPHMNCKGGTPALFMEICDYRSRPIHGRDKAALESIGWYCDERGHWYTKDLG